MLDTEVFKLLDVDDTWIYNKYELSKRLGYKTGLKGMYESCDKYIVRPVYNLLGMSRGAYVTNDISLIPDGFFWCEYFEGIHYSIDYDYCFNPILTLIGHKKELEFTCWEKIDNTIKCPSIIKEWILTMKYIPERINVEFIGDKIIEIHLRENDEWNDIPNEVTKLYVVNNETLIPTRAIYIENKDYKRKGFYYDFN
ncbi:MAG: hypothetical protein HC917_05540 [Richelia sp. SM2_1_7]|nr:hypothetical protein [Richelia sp. SM2_1_7]